MRLLLTAILSLACGSAMAAARIANVSAKAVGPLETQVAVSIERPTPLDLLCDAVVDLGDGAAQPTLKFGIGDKHTKTLQHKYAKAGTYKVTVKGTGKCEGSKSASVTVQADVAKAAAAAAAHCPKGWTLVADSLKGNRYSCRADPPAAPLKCAGDTKYFAENGLIGCR